MTNSEQVVDALSFLENHPAISKFSGLSLFGNNFFFGISKCCKNNRWEDSRKEVTIYRTDENYLKYKELFDEEETKCKDEIEKKYCSIDIPYQKMYGEPWVFDHLEYWAELTFHVYNGKTFSSNDEYDDKNWLGYCGFNVSSMVSFDDMVVHAAVKVKEIFGDFEYERFPLLTTEEVANHNNEHMFIHISAEEGADAEDLVTMKHNPNYIDVSDGKQNRRWLEWFVKTPYCRKEWGEEFDKFLAGQSQKPCSYEYI